MTDSSPRQALTWEQWNAAVNKQLAQLQRDARKANNTADMLAALLLGTPDEKRTEPRIIDLIRNVAWDLIREQKIMRDAGIWSRERQYGPGAAVTFDGTIWACQTENKGTKPGDGALWRLMHKSADVMATNQLRSVVRDEVRKQLQEKTR